MFESRKIAAALGVMTAFLLSCGIAAAAWTSGGTGTATATAGTASALTTTTADAVTTGLLFPGGAAGNAVIKIANPNPYPVTVTGIAGSGTVTASGGAGTCTTTGVSFTAPSSVSIAIAANGSATHTMTGAVTMNSTSENGCQGATFSIPVTITGVSG